MNNNYQRNFVDININKCSSYPLYPMNYIKMQETIQNNQVGFLSINVIDEVSNEPIPNKTITIYVTDGIRRDIPVMHIITTINPIKFELPMANDLGTLIVGPEYNFSTYNIRVDAFGFISNNVYNVRLFPNTTSNFNIELFPVTQLRERPTIEERLDIPPHPRDIIIGTRI